MGLPLERQSLCDHRENRQSSGSAQTSGSDLIHVAKFCSAAVRYLRPFVRKYSSTNRRIAEDRLPCRRVSSILATNVPSVACRACAISFSSLQKASSRLTLVLCPSMTMECLTTEDFIRASHSPRTTHTLESGPRYSIFVPANAPFRVG
jgi:hypothetical protein